MKLIEFSYKNILSYGNLLQKFEFSDEPQLILVEGENGSGKSSIKEALTVSLYGRSAIRKMKDIPNWINKNAYTNVKFITSAGETVEISRGIEPNFSDIKINDATHNLPDKRKVDEFIEDELTKIPFPVFCNTISLSFDDFKSFVNLSQSDKRKIVDRIFGIDILGEMRNLVKEELKQNKKELEIINSKISKNTSALNTSLSQLSQLKEKLSKKKDSQTDELKNSISSKKKDLAAAREKYSKFKGLIDEANSKLNLVRDEISSARSSITDLAEKLELYKNNRCPHCLNDLTSDSSIKTKEAIEKRKKIMDAKLPELRTSFTQLNDNVLELTNSQNLSKEDYFKIDVELKQFEKNLAAMLNEIESDETESISAIISSLRSDLKSDEDDLSTKGETLTLFTVLDELLSDTGIKKTLIDKIIPTLNSRILEISKKLEFKFQFEFDSDFNPIISYLGMEVSAESLSSGQRKKMNLIVLLAFIEIVKMKHNQMNIMFLDEIFSSLDKNNVYRAIEILKEYATTYGMTIFVVSHEALPEEFFNYRILVKNKDHFSEMEITKIGHQKV
jgi:DNA repair exonuclease SbcCD ATPase subunit